MDLGQQETASFVIPTSQLLANTTDSDMSGVTVANVTTNDPAVTALLGPTDVTITASGGFKGQVDLTFDVIDGGVPAATAQGAATVDIVNVVTLAAEGGTVTAPDGSGSYALLDDAAGAAGQTDFAVATGANEAVVFQEIVSNGVATPYAGIEAFRLEGGDDLIDLSGAIGGYQLDGGPGNDWLRGGDGADTLTGGPGNDRFDAGSILPALPDVITDYEAGEVIDLTAILRLQGGESVGDRVELDGGTLRMTDTAGSLHDLFGITDSGGGIPDSVTVAFEDAASVQQTALV